MEVHSSATFAGISFALFAIKKSRVRLWHFSWVMPIPRAQRPNAFIGKQSFLHEKRSHHCPEISQAVVLTQNPDKLFLITGRG